MEAFIAGGENLKHKIPRDSTPTCGLLTLTDHLTLLAWLEPWRPSMQAERILGHKAALLHAVTQARVP